MATLILLDKTMNEYLGLKQALEYINDIWNDRMHI